MGSETLPAPQGQALASIIEGILGQEVPLQKYASGAALGALLSASGIGGLYARFAGDERLKNVPRGGSLVTFTLVE